MLFNGHLAPRILIDHSLPPGSSSLHSPPRLAPSFSAQWMPSTVGIRRSSLSEAFRVRSLLLRSHSLAAIVGAPRRRISTTLRKNRKPRAPNTSRPDINDGALLQVRSRHSSRRG